MFVEIFYEPMENLNYARNNLGLGSDEFTKQNYLEFIKSVGLTEACPGQYYTVNPYTGKSI